MCKIDGCNRVSAYKEQDVCQKHYFRFMRYGTYELNRKRKYRLSNPAGYQSIFEPKHPLAQKSGYVYEHRFIVFNEYGYNLPDCELCGKPTRWDTCHIDHIDEDVTNNILKNLRPVCRPCNTNRGRKPEHTYNHHHCISYKGKSGTAKFWASQNGVDVTGATIVSRLQRGMTVEDALFSEKKTHKSQK